ncbi:hypothetical protein MML48_4g00019204 [Holotrichia oblita]|uniref:Uncharacterized protein n=1 Tax=Holotrichia oblita TaxID=644536 RepID=A0ACB9TAQ0_HOLOL|nr:hypothetical protein MML48_4g00019204 [Holotrichia oblita]
MSDYDRNKYYGKKKFQSHRGESGNSFNSRFFNSKNLYKPDGKETDKDAKPKNIKQPTILLKAPDRSEERSSSPKQTVKEAEPTPHIAVVTSSAHEVAASPVIKSMTKSVKLIDDGSIYTENVQDFLQENNDFLAVGVIGTQGVGKSTLLNLLVHSKVTEKVKREIFKVYEFQEDDGLDNIKLLTNEMLELNMNKTVEGEKNYLPFLQQTPKDVEANINTTYGIDFYITENRMMLLDCQPFISSSTLDELMRSESKRSNVISEFLPLENSCEIQGLQHAAFLLSVCHIIILVEDYFFDSNIIRRVECLQIFINLKLNCLCCRFLQTAEMLKPTISNPEDLKFADSFPHLLIVHNSAQMEDFTPRRFAIMQNVYRKVFKNSKLHLDSGLGLSTSQIIQSLCPENCDSPINLFLIPEYNEKTENMYKGHPPLAALINKLRSNLLGCTRYSLTPVQLSEKNWLVYSAKVWDHVKKSSFFVEYTKLMP